MIFIISMAIAAAGAVLLRNQLRKHAGWFYLVSVLISIMVIRAVWKEITFSGVFGKWIFPVLARGGLAGALFIIVMITGALPNETKAIKWLMPIRGQLSILASIFALAHNAAYGRTYFRLLFSKPQSMPAAQFLAAICSLLMLLIMLPLFITSFKTVRKKINAVKWKKLQRSAYLFYGLLCTHIMLLMVPNAVKGRSGYVLSVCVYGTVFVWYLICRIMKASAVKNKTMKALGKKERVVFLICLGTMMFAALFSEVSVQHTGGDSVENVRKYSDGEYEGTAFGNGSNITVRVTLEADCIRQIIILSQGEDEPYFSDAMYVIDEMIAQNSTQVDVVSGATYSSEGIIDAVKKALLQAEYHTEGAQ